MIPTQALRIQTMLRSMLEVIIPAIDPANQLARDQAQILVGNLRLLAAQADRSFEYELVELRELVEQLLRLHYAAAGGPVTGGARAAAGALLDRAQPVASLPIPRQAALSATVREARAAVDALLQASSVDGTGEFRRTIAQSVLEYSAHENLRERAWFAAAGLEVDTSALPGLDIVLGRGFADQD
jgi:hypothetical protein